MISRSPRRKQTSCCSPTGSTSARTSWRRSAGGPRAGRPACAWPRSGSRTAPDPEQFVADFAGDDRVVADYLLAEVLSGERPRRRRFLLQTSIADRLCGDLADAITGSDDGAETLEALERENGFVVALDSHRDWYRFHRLFAELLRVHARREFGDELRRAAPASGGAGTSPPASRPTRSATPRSARDWDLADRARVRALAGALGPVRGGRAARGAGADARRAARGRSPARRRAGLPRARGGRDRARAAAPRPRGRGHVQSLPRRSRGRHLDTIALAQLRAAQADGDLDRAQEIAAELLDDGPRATTDGHSRCATRSRTCSWASPACGTRTRRPPSTSSTPHSVLARTAGLEGVALSALGHLALTTALRTGPLRARELARDALDEAASPGVDHRRRRAGARRRRRDRALRAAVRRRRDERRSRTDRARRGPRTPRWRRRSSSWRPSSTPPTARRSPPCAGSTAGAAVGDRRLPARPAVRARLLVEHLGDCDGTREALDRARPRPPRSRSRSRRRGWSWPPAIPARPSRRSSAPLQAAPLLGVTAVESALLEAVAYEQIRDPAAADTALEDGARARRRDGAPRRVPRRRTARRAAAAAAASGSGPRTPSSSATCSPRPSTATVAPLDGAAAGAAQRARVDDPALPADVALEP